MFVILFLAAIVGTLGAPLDDAVEVGVQPVQPVIAIISNEDVVNADGSFNYGYESSNGIKVEESGYIKKNPNPDVSSRLGGEGNEGGDIRVVTGSFSYTAPDGTLITLRYIADENGFQPIGDHLPVAPAIPEAIQRSLDTQNVGAQERSGKSIDLPVKAVRPAPIPQQLPSLPEPVPSQPEQAPSQPDPLPTELPAAEN